MNIHVPQAHQSSVELETIMSVTERIVSSQNNAPCIGLVQDALLSSFLLTRNDIKVSKHIFFDCIATLRIFPDMQEFYSRAKDYWPKYFVKRVSKTTKRVTFDIKNEVPGKLLYSILFPKNFVYEYKGIEINRGIIKESSQPLTKSIVGAKANSIVHILYNEHSPKTAANFLSWAQFLLNRWLPTFGFSVGISDCLIKNYEDVEQTMQKCFAQVDEKIEMNGDNVEQEINNILNTATNVGQKLVKDGMRGGQNNRFVIMGESGAKGNYINCSQITALVGQQNICGKRPPLGITGGTRSLPHFELGDNRPDARGFIVRSYYDGLSPTQTFFHLMAGREGLVDTAIKTAKSGYIQRRVVKKLEDKNVTSDNTVRTSNGCIVQFLYGADGFDASKLYNVNGKLCFIDPINLAKQLNCDAKDKPQKLSKQQIEDICSIIKINGLETSNLLDAQRRIKNCLGEFLNQVELAPSKYDDYFRTIRSKFFKAIAAPGEAVGIVSASSIGEPTTQATLNTFHFTGVAGKDVTTGVPRFEECLVATKNPKTPSCIIHINNPELIRRQTLLEKYGELLRKHAGQEKNLAKINEAIYKNRKECLKIVSSYRSRVQYNDVNTYLKNKPQLLRIAKDEPGCSPLTIFRVKDYVQPWWVDIAHKVKYGDDLEIQPQDWIIKLELDKEKLILFDKTCQDIADIITNHKNKEKPFARMLAIASPENIAELVVYIDFENITGVVEKKLGLDTENSYQLITPENMNYFYARDIVMKNIPDIQVGGIWGISAIFPKEIIKGDKRTWVLDTQGANYLDVLNLDFCDTFNTVCDDFWQVYEIYGIEAARELLVQEITKCLSFDGSYINPRHIELLVDGMTHTGTLTSVARGGIGREVGPIAKCSFEETVDNFAIASIFGEREAVNSISSRITLGMLGKVGTGFSQVVPNLKSIH